MSSPGTKVQAARTTIESFNATMACTAKIVVNAILSHYENGFVVVKVLVDVGGGIGVMKL
ncbi:hypothetical protein FRX31_004633 [Thalictrum thalictroides]|uniref:O-methyltransferase C-terminal domain-containing protein n=1 Tax=Thalictrum thalictroides TaxID=46969 RepID=A0A7J6XBF6_THATH|nr:hypothetical protein FRX31_004633 [Thalictrum thalictroides]